MEATLVVGALIIAGLVVTRGLAADRPSGGPPRQVEPFAGQSSLGGGEARVGLAVSVGNRPPLHIFTGPSAHVHRGGVPPTGDDYQVALARGLGGTMGATLLSPTAVGDSNVLNVTLLFPWAELTDRYKTINLVVR